MHTTYKLIFPVVIFFTTPIINVSAEVVDIPHKFQAGKPSSAAQVNENFATLSKAVNEIWEAKTSCVGSGPNDEMVRVGPMCVDKYEASVWDSLQNGQQTTQDQSCKTNPANCYCHPMGNNCSRTKQNNELNSSAIFARSVKGVKAAARFTWFQAQQACANVGKRLLTNAEWQMAAAGTNTSNCDVDDVQASLDNTGHNVQCVSNWGVHDMVGGLWERVGDWMHGRGPVTTNNPSGTWTPAYVTGTRPVDPAAPIGGQYNITDVMAGVNIAHRSESSLPLGNFPAAILRGGSFDWGSVSSGEFALLGGWSPMAMTASIGFRCGR